MQPLYWSTTSGQRLFTFLFIHRCMWWKICFDVQSLPCTDWIEKYIHADILPVMQILKSVAMAQRAGMMTKLNDEWLHENIRFFVILNVFKPLFLSSNLTLLSKYLNQRVSMSIFMIKITTTDRNAPPWNADESNIVDPVCSLSSDLRCLILCNRLTSVHKYRIYYLVLVVQMEVKCSIAPCSAAGSLGLDTRCDPVAGTRRLCVLPSQLSIFDQTELTHSPAKIL